MTTLSVIGLAPRRTRPSASLFRFIAGRLLQMAVTAVLLIPLVFFLFRAPQGDPATAVIGPDVDPSLEASLRERYGLNGSTWDQLWAYGTSVIHGDLGYSFQYNMPVSDLLGEYLFNTAVLVLPALAIAITFGVVLGAISATSSKRVDGTLRTTAFVVKAAPIFWISSLALIVFSLKLQWFPSIGMGTVGSESSWRALFTWDFLHHLALPLTILVMYYLIEPMLTMRTSMREVLDQEFISLGKAQGLPRRRIILRHGARNAALPVVSLAPVLADNLITGQVIVETVFSWPGIGRATVDAVQNLDYPMMQALFLLSAISVLVINAVVDVVYAYLDPRVRMR